jgi:hypothetical protein
MIRILAVLAVALMPALAHAHDRHYAISSEMHDWFMTLRSGKGPCCADADGSVVKDADWQSKDGHYRVYLPIGGDAKDGSEWVDVPDEAVITQPNLYGRTMVWTMFTSMYGGPVKTAIRCFMPGSMI